MKSLLFPLLLASVAVAAEPNAKINGPTAAAPGETVFFSTAGSRWDNQAFSFLHSFEHAVTLQSLDGAPVLVVQKIPAGVWTVSVVTSGVVEGEVRQASDSLTITVEPPQPPDPPTPVPVPPDLDGLAKVMYEAAQKVVSHRRAEEAGILVGVFQDVLTKAAAVSTMNAQQMLDEGAERFVKSMPRDRLKAWQPWLDVFLRKMKAVKNDRESVMAAWREVIKGLEAVR